MTAPLDHTWRGHLTRGGGTIADQNGWELRLSLDEKVLQGRLPGVDAVVWSGPITHDAGTITADVTDAWGFVVRITGIKDATGYALEGRLVGVPSNLAVPFVDDERVVV